MKKEKACFACKMKKKVKLFPICLHMWEFFCNFAADFSCIRVCKIVTSHGKIRYVTYGTY